MAMRKAKKIDYDPAHQEPAVRKSICTGEMTVGFVDLATGRFIDYKLVRSQSEIDEFMRQVGTDKIRTVY
ncbi:MAG: aspartate dehydrogenase [Clostridiales bacterium]|nr:aspartate dehydrogenase [Clostridiales bacterium]